MRHISGLQGVLVALGLMMVACSQTTPSGSTPNTAAQDTAATRSAIEAANARFLDAFKRGDTVGLMANYADDAVIMMPNEVACAEVRRILPDEEFTVAQVWDRLLGS